MALDRSNSSSLKQLALKGLTAVLKGVTEWRKMQLRIPTHRSRFICELFAHASRQSSHVLLQLADVELSWDTIPASRGCQNTLRLPSSCDWWRHAAVGVRSTKSTMYTLPINPSIDPPAGLCPVSHWTPCFDQRLHKNQRLRGCRIVDNPATRIVWWLSEQSLMSNST